MLLLVGVTFITLYGIELGCDEALLEINLGLVPHLLIFVLWHGSPISSFVRQYVGLSVCLCVRREKFFN